MEGMKMGKMMKVDMDMPNVIHLDEDELPAIRDWKVGETYRIVLEVEQTAQQKDEGEGEEDLLSADFKILSASVEGEEPEDNEEEDSNGEYESEDEGESDAKGAKVEETIVKKEPVKIAMAFKRRFHK